LANQKQEKEARRRAIDKERRGKKNVKPIESVILELVARNTRETTKVPKRQDTETLETNPESKISKVTLDQIHKTRHVF
jgi:hypothetical protein